MIKIAMRVFLAVMLFGGGIVGSAQAQEGKRVSYPMFEVGDVNTATNLIDFMWTPSDTDSSEMYIDLVVPLMKTTGKSIAITFYMVSEPDDETDVLDRQLGAVLTCVPAQRLADFSKEILLHNKTEDDVRSVEALFEASKAFGNTRQNLEDCLSPSVLARISITSDEIKKMTQVESYPALLVNGVDFSDAESIDDILKTLK